jgi:hypothetical protein
VAEGRTNTFGAGDSTDVRRRKTLSRHASLVGYAAAALAMGALAAGCGGGAGSSAQGARRCPPPPTGSGVINETTGALRGARIGDGLHAVLQHFTGVERRWDSGSELTLSRCGQGPLSATIAGSHTRIARLPDAVLVFSGRPARLTAFTAAGRGARTRAGVGVGEALARVRARYGATAVRCGHEIGDDGPLWPSCHVTSGGFDVYFGGDPINEIAIRRGSDFG